MRDADVGGLEDLLLVVAFADPFDVFRVTCDTERFGGVL